MNKIKLDKAINEYLSSLNHEISAELEDLKEREERVAYYQSFTQERIISMDESEFTEYISKLWAMLIWGNKKYKIDQLINDNSFNN